MSQFLEYQRLRPDVLRSTVASRLRRLDGYLAKKRVIVASRSSMYRTNSHGFFGVIKQARAHFYCGCCGLSQGLSGASIILLSTFFSRDLQDEFEFLRHLRGASWDMYLYVSVGASYKYYLMSHVVCGCVLSLRWVHIQGITVLDIGYQATAQR